MIRFNKCSIGYDSPLIFDLTLDVEPCEILTILGPTGIGKSTLLRLIGNVDTQKRKPIVFEGHYKKPDDIQVGLVFQTLEQLFPWKTALENVLFPCLGHRNELTKDQALKRARQLLEEVGLQEHADKYPSDLSGGMRQRVAIARAMFSQPELLLMDEPFSSLDAITREKLQFLLKNLQHKHNMTVLFITHDIEEALKLSHKILLIDGKGHCDLIRCKEYKDTKAVREKIKNALKKGI